MKLFRVLLVDDDYLVIKDMKGMIDWEALGFHVVATARNGKTAMDAVKKYKPDLIICDISMPVVDGLTFIESLRAADSNVRILILSAYDNFSYAQRAIKSDVYDYILKNEITPDSLTAKLLKIGNELDSGMARIQRETRVMLKDYLNSKTDMEDLEIYMKTDSQNRKRMQKLLSKRLAYYIFSRHIPFSTSETYYSDYEEAGRQLYHHSQDMLYNSKRYPVVFYTSNFLIIGADCSHYPQKQPTDFPAEAKNLLQTLRRSDSKIILIAFTPVLCSLGDLKRLFWENMNALLYKALLSQTSPVVLESQESVKQKIRKLPHFNFSSFKEQDNPQIVSKEIDMYINNLAGNRDARGLIRFFGDVHKICQTRISESIGNSVEILCDTLEQYSDSICKLYQAYVQASGAEKKYSHTTQNVIRLIQVNYQDHDLSVEQLAEWAELSSGRLSVIFKKDTGLTISDYITKYRMEQAVKLLQTTNLKIYEISEQVGYLSSQYFSQVLLKHTGKRPLDFRRASS
ncbi:response regulator transcription factor [Diplocloster agilis]|uniref:response regulator transcription factor n=1 Tax=Diplocloster agilis TaxID=2850323 RepID=UPI000820D7DE|nr:response regulator [Suonthocola fibrivorans]MCU6735797.1 response regulator [Suonthocola fibrivorans]SCJ82084.1 Uncharacterized response regulatory protein SA0215 [uncultured Clostridium sp.]